MSGEWHEAEIIIGKKKLNKAQSMTLRVALTGFVSEMRHVGLGDDNTGKSIAEGYMLNGEEVIGMLFKSIEKQQEE